jgi:hypothetical protein
LGDTIEGRFKGAEAKAKIMITEVGDSYIVSTPFKRKYGPEKFIAALRAIPGRKYVGAGGNEVPKSSKRELFEFFREFFPGEFGTGPQGVFQVPAKGNSK